jgi:putative ABC transport system substrate-binding protein
MEARRPPVLGRAFQGKSCGRIAEQVDPRISSWPGLSCGPSADGPVPWSSTSSSVRNKDVDARIKSAQDELRLISVSQRRVIVADVISPDSPAVRGGLRQRGHRITRRGFLVLAGATASAWNPAAAEVKSPRIGFIQAGSRQENQSLLDAFRAKLSALGWTDGSNIAVLDRWTEEDTEQLPAIVTELIGSKVTVLVTAGTPATLAAKRASATLPIVFVGVDDPVSLGVVDSLGQPGGNATGLSLTSSEVITERLELLRELVPGLRRLAVIVRDDPGLDQKLQDIRSDAQRKRIQALMLEATTAKALELAFARLNADRCEAVYVASGPLGPVKRARVIALAAESRLPAMYSFRIFPIEGGLMSFAADYNDLSRRAAGFVDKILKGAKPAAMPVEPPRKFQLTVNLKTAKALDLTIPPTMLAAADEVIE